MQNDLLMYEQAVLHELTKLEFDSQHYKNKDIDHQDSMINLIHLGIKEEQKKYLNDAL